MIYLVVHISYCIIDKKFNLAELLNFILSNKVKWRDVKWSEVRLFIISIAHTLLLPEDTGGGGNSKSLVFLGAVGAEEL